MSFRSGARIFNEENASSRHGNNTLSENDIETDFLMSKQKSIPLTLPENKQQEVFSKFRRHQCNFYAFFAFQLFTCIILIPTSFWNVKHFPSAFSTATFVITLITSGVCGWAIILMHCIQKFTSYKNQLINLLLPWFETIWLIGICLTITLIMTISAINGPCKNPDGPYEKNTGCSFETTAHSMQMDKLLGSLIFPFILSIIVKGVKWNWVCFAFILTFSISLTTMLVLDKTRSLASFLVFSLICLLAMYENQRQSVHVFLLAQSQQHLLDENERLAVETHANELRSMIGNVAHDLKTPLSAFISGMDILGAVCSELSATMLVKDDYITERLATFHDTVDHIKNIHQFMLMTINRCIDYTKASQGLSLVPRMETICLRESIDLPLECMKNLQNNKITMRLSGISEQICPYIITDKQWLQENILCLLSNAAKYSAAGSVSIDVQFIDTAAAVELREKTATVEMLTKSRTLPFLPMIRISIEDSGIGISEENMDKLFQPFKQAQRLAGGTGLGLYSLAKRVEALDGCYGVSVRPDNKQGSVFWFAIPYRPDASRTEVPSALPSALPSQTQLFVEDASATMHTDTSPRPNTTSSVVANTVSKVISPRSTKGVKEVELKLNILVVDDSLPILKMTGMLLKRQGYTFETVENGAEALTLLSNQKQLDRETFSKQAFHVVLMDLQMPIMDGLESTRRLREFESGLQIDPTDNEITTSTSSTTLQELQLRKQIQHFRKLHTHQLIIGVSANSDHETVNAAYDAGVDAFIPKPFNMVTFKETYHGLLQKL